MICGFAQPWMIGSLLLVAVVSFLRDLFSLLHRENIFRAHRSHLFQWLSNEMGWSHVLVSALYALVQLFINILVIVLVSREMMNLPVFLIISAVLCMSFLAVRWVVWKRIKSLS